MYVSVKTKCAFLEIFSLALKSVYTTMLDFKVSVARQQNSDKPYLL